MKPFPLVLTIAAALLTATSGVRRAVAAPPWVDREITLPRHDWAFDFGLGIAHSDSNQPVLPSVNGVGMNLEMGVGVTERLQLGLRTGLRVNDGGRATQADEYGRLFDRQTFGTNGDALSNPEFLIRGGLVRTRIFELGLEGRAYLPIERGSRFGGLFGVPLAFHFGGAVRLDTGVYIPVLFYDPAFYAVSLPAHVWIQASDKVWLGPLAGLVFRHWGYGVDPFGRATNGPLPYARGTEETDLQLGFGLGYSITSYLDFKTMVLFPRINEAEGARNFGLSAGLQVRIE